MSLLLPLFLAGTAAVALPLFLHLLRQRPRQRVPFPSLRFLGASALRDSRRHRLRRWFLLLLRCLLIGLLALAFSRPFWPLPHADTRRAVIVVVDNSASVQARGRGAAIEAWLAPALAALRPPDELGVLLLQPTPRWLAPLGRDLDAGRAALRPFPSGYETSHYRAGLDLAAAVLARNSARHRQILVAGDEQQLAWASVGFDRPLPPGVELLAAPPAPPPRRQAAIVGLRVERSEDGKLLIVALIRGYAPALESRTISCYAGDLLLGRERVVLAAGRTEEIGAQYAVPHPDAAQAIRVALDPDDLPADDTAYATLAATGDRRVMLAGPRPGDDVDFLGRALAAVRGGGLTVLHLDPLPAAGGWDPSAVAVLRGDGPFAGADGAALDRFVAAGGSAWILCDGSAAQGAWLARHGVTVAAEVPPPGDGLRLRDLDLAHPLFAAFAGHSLAPLLAPVFHRGWSLEGEEVAPLARWPDRGIAIAEVATGAGRLLVTGFGDTREDSTFPVQSGYVPFVHQAVVWLQQDPPGAARAARVNDTVLLPGAGTWRPLYSPRMGPAIAVDNFVVPSAPGIYEFRQGSLVRWYAVNLDPAESDLAAWPTPGDFARLVSPGKAAATPALPVIAGAAPTADPRFIDERDAWWWLLAAALAVGLAELALANRTAP